MRITQHAYDQWVEFGLSPSDLLPNFASATTIDRAPFAMVPHHSYHHNAAIDAYFVVSHRDHEPALITVLHPSRTDLQRIRSSTPSPRPATFHSPLSEREWLKSELTRLKALDNPDLKITIETIANEIRALKDAARSYQKNFEKYKNERREPSKCNG